MMKIVGILVGLGGALLCISTQKSDDLASDAFSGNLFCLVSSVIYAVYLILSNRFLKRTGPYTLMRYTFSGAAVSSLIVMAFVGYEASLTTPPLHFLAYCLIAVCVDISNCYQLFTNTDRSQISEYDSRGYIWVFNFGRRFDCFISGRTG